MNSHIDFTNIIKMTKKILLVFLVVYWQVAVVQSTIYDNDLYNVDKKETPFHELEQFSNSIVSVDFISTNFKLNKISKSTEEFNCEFSTSHSLDLNKYFCKRIFESANIIFDYNIFLERTNPRSPPFSC